MEFTFEKEENKCFNFLDVTVSRKNNVFAASVYHKPLGPFSEILTIANLRHATSRVWTCAEPEFRLSWMKLCSSDNHYTTAPLNYKVSLVSAIIFRSFTIPSEIPKFHQGIWKIKDIFIKNGYSESFIDKYVKAFLSKVFIAKRIIQTTEKK